VGDFADMAIAEALSMDEYYLDNETPDDPYFSIGAGRWRGFRPRSKTCKSCGQTGLWWQDTEQFGWRLHTAVGELHTCSYKSAIGKKPQQNEYFDYLDQIPWE
jgi:hypothetical protein